MPSRQASTPSLAYRHVDVFSPSPFGGNSLTVFPHAAGLGAAQMQALTQEMRHFESIFLEPPDEPAIGAEEVPVRARVFDLTSELPFAGHPLLGAACVLHALVEEGDAAGRDYVMPAEGDQPPPASRSWRFGLAKKSVQVCTELLGEGGEVAGGDADASARGRHPSRFRAVLDQGRPEFLGRVASEVVPEIALALDITTDDLHSVLPLEVVSTGLRYLVVPLVKGLGRARIASSDFEAILGSVGAEFAYVLDLGDPARPEARHWNNDGIIEDVATGSGAGCAAAYMARHGVVPLGREIVLRQGRFTGRPSEIRLCAEGRADDVRRVLVGGDVALVGRGTVDALPLDRIVA